MPLKLPVTGWLTTEVLPSAFSTRDVMVPTKLPTMLTVPGCWLGLEPAMDPVRIPVILPLEIGIMAGWGVTSCMPVMVPVVGMIPRLLDPVGAMVDRLDAAPSIDALVVPGMDPRTLLLPGVEETLSDG